MTPRSTAPHIAVSKSESFALAEYEPCATLVGPPKRVTHNKVKGRSVKDLMPPQAILIIVEGEAMQTSMFEGSGCAKWGSHVSYRGTAAKTPWIAHCHRNSLTYNTMPGLTDLPSELLFQIIDHTLTSSAVLSKDGMRYRPERKACQRNLYCIPTCSMEFLNTPQTLGLLLTSQRINAETKEYISKAPQTFKFDIAVINDHWVSAKLVKRICSQY
jgi:hypothetical protein